MIIKHIKDTKNKSSAANRIKYIHDKAQKSVINGVSSYAVDKSYKVWYANLPNDKELAIKQMEATQSQNKRCKASKTYHYVISFREGEKPEDNIMFDVEQKVSKALGLGEHERVIAIHDDTAHYHMHIVVNKINPITHNTNVMSNDHYVMDDMCKKLELEYGFQVDKHIDYTQNKAHKNHKAIDFEVHTGTESFITYLKREFKPDALCCNSWQELHNEARKIGVIVKLQGAGLVFKSVKHQNITVKASDIDRNLGKGQIEKRLGPFYEFESVKIDLNAQNKEINVSDIQTQASTKNNPNNSKLEVEKNIQQKNKNNFYEKKPLHKNSSVLWQKYLDIEKSKEIKQVNLLFQAKNKYTNVMSEVKNSFIMKKHSIQQSNLSYQHKKIEIYNTTQIYRSNTAIISNQYSEERKSAYIDTKKQSWLAFLMKEAMHDQDAMKALQSNLKKKHIEVATKNNIQPMKMLQADNKKYVGCGIVGKNGEVHYKTIDNGQFKVIDNAIVIVKDSKQANINAIELAKELYGDALLVKGSQGFINDIKEKAKEKNIQISTSNELGF
jgi:Relaxase/Mobilisation nuclease domain